MESVPSPQSFIFSDDYICQWDSCLKNFDDAEMLYEHLRDDHVGRKAHHNLCLTCRWDKCNVPTFAKRDHITSHLRVHVASKPYHCEICRKGFKRPQDLKKHEKTHQENPSGGPLDPTDGCTAASSHLQPAAHDHGYQPLTPPSYLDRSPSIAASTVSSVQSPFNMPMSPASMADSTESWSNPGLDSPLYSTSSDLYSSPGPADQDIDLMNNQFNRPNIDVSGAYYGAFPPVSSGFEDLVSPMSGKRSRDGVDELLMDTLGSFAMEAKKKRLDPSYDDDMMGHLNALSTILEVSELTPDRLVSNLPVGDWNQFNQLGQFCATLFEDVSGEVFEPQAYDTLFPDYEQKQNPVTLDGGAGFGGVNGFQNYNAAGVNLNLGMNNNNSSSGNNNSNMGFNPAISQGGSIYSTVIPDDPFVPTSSAASSMGYGTERLPWEIPASNMPMPGVGVMKSMPSRNAVHQQVNPYDHRFVTLNNAMNSRPVPEVKVEVKEEVFEPKVLVKVERTYADMSTQTKAKQEKLAAEGMMMMQRPAEKKKQPKPSVSAYEGMDPEFLMMSAPAVPNTPLPELEAEEISIIEQLENDQEETLSDDDIQESGKVANPTAQQATSNKFGGFVEKARAKQAAAAAAAAANASSELLDPLEAMTRQLAETRLDGAHVKAASKPLTEGDMERQVKAQQARVLCAQDPTRKHHAEVVLHLLKSIDAVMVNHRQRVAALKGAQAKHAGGAVPRVPVVGSASSTSMYPRTTGGGIHVQNQGQIRTVSSYLPRRTGPHQPSPLHQDNTRPAVDYSQLRSNLEGSSKVSTTHNSSSNGDSSQSVTAHGRGSSSDSPVLYPTSDLHTTEDVPFELSEEERRFIEEDNANTAAAQAASSGSAYPSVHV